MGKMGDHHGFLVWSSCVGNGGGERTLSFGFDKEFAWDGGRDVPWVVCLQELHRLSPWSPHCAQSKTS